MSGIINKLLKSNVKIVTRNGKRYYASGKNSGREVGTVRKKSQTYSVDSVNSRLELGIPPLKPGMSESLLIDSNIGLPATGIKSEVEYTSKSNSGLVGTVAFGKTSRSNQEFLNENLGYCEMILDTLGIRFKSKVDFVCQTLDSAKDNVCAEFQPLPRFFEARPRINIYTSSEISKSLMHEIGHALDYSMGSGTEYFSHGDIGKLELDQLNQILKSSPIFKESDDKDYLKTPTEIFARCFEVLSYTEALKLNESGKIPDSFLESFFPDFLRDSVGLDFRPGYKKVSASISEFMGKIIKNNEIKKGILMKSEDKDLKYVAIVPIQHGQVLVGERREDGILTTVAGGIEKDELPEQAAIRELWEEAAISVQPEDLVYLSTKDTPNGKKIKCFWVDLDGKIINPSSKLDPDQEVAEWVWKSIGDLPALDKENSQQYNRLLTISEGVKAYYDKKYQENVKDGVFNVLTDTFASKLTKARIVTIGGKQYYAEGRNAGKEVGSVRPKIKVDSSKKDPLAEKEVLPGSKEGSKRSVAMKYKGSDSAKERAKKELEDLKNSPKPNLTKSELLAEKLSKAKTVTRNGVRYYADGKHAGKRVGSVRVKGVTKLETSDYSGDNSNGDLSHDGNFYEDIEWDRNYGGFKLGDSSKYRFPDGTEVNGKITKLELDNAIITTSSGREYILPIKDIQKV